MDHPSPAPRAGPNVGTDVVDALQQLLSKGDEADRCHAARALGAIGDRSAVSALIERLQDDDIDVCIDAATALGEIGDPLAVGALMELLHTESNGEVQTAVIDALGHLADDRLVEPLLELAQRRPEGLAWDEDEGWDPWWDMRRRAVTILGQLRTARAAPILVALLNDRDSEDIEDEIMRSLALIGADGEAVLARQLSQGNARQRRRAVRALGICGTSSAWKTVLKGMKDSEAEVRAAAVHTFGSHPEIARFLQLLLVMLRDRNESVREAVLDIVAGLQVAEDQVTVALEQVMPLLEDDSPRVRTAAIDTLRAVIGDNCDQHALDRVRSLLGDQNDEVTAGACKFMAKYGTPADTAALFVVVRDTQRDARARRAAGLAIGEVSDAARDTIDQLTELLADGSQAVRLAALSALHRLDERMDDDTIAVSGALSTPSTAAADVPASTSQPATPLQTIIAVLGGDVSVSGPPRETAASDVDDGPPDPAADGISDGPEAPSGGRGNDEVSPAEDRPTLVNSTLEAIVRDNEAVKQSIESAPATESASTQTEELSEELEEYVDLVEKNLEQSEANRQYRNVSVADDIRRLSARILGDSDDSDAITALITAMNDDDPQVRRDAANSLAVIARRGKCAANVQNAYGALVTHASADERDVRLACVRALGRLGLASTVDPLLRCLEDADASVRVQAVSSLGELLGRPPVGYDINQVTQARITDSLRQLLGDQEAGVRQAVAEILGDLDQDDAVESIIEAAFRDEGGQARQLGRALRKFSKQQKVSAQLLRMLDSSPSSSNRRMVIEMIEEVSKQ